MNEPLRRQPTRDRSGSRRRMLAVGLIAGSMCFLIAIGVILRSPSTYAVSELWLVLDPSSSVGDAAGTQGGAVSAPSSLARFNNPTIVADLIARRLRDPWTAGQIRNEGVNSNLEVSTRRTVVSDTPEHGPIISLTLRSDRPEDLLSDLSTVSDGLRVQLSRLQNPSPADSSVSLVTVARSVGPMLVPRSRIRPIAAFAIASILLGWLAATAASRIPTKDQARRHGRSVPAPPRDHSG